MENSGAFIWLVNGGVLVSVVVAASAAFLCGPGAGVAPLVVMAAAGWVAQMFWRDRQMRRAAAADATQMRANTAAQVGSRGDAVARRTCEFDSQLTTTAREERTDHRVAAGNSAD